MFVSTKIPECVSLPAGDVLLRSFRSAVTHVYHILHIHVQLNCSTTIQRMASAGALNRRIVLASRPIGEPKASDFRLESVPIPAIKEGEVLLKTKFFSLDPYMRGRMNSGKSYASPQEIGEVMGGGSVSEVVATACADYNVGDVVQTHGGWQEYTVVKGSGLTRVDPAAAPISTSLGILGMPGMTAYTGLLTIGAPKEGETLVVAAASGAVGAAVGQIGKIKGCRVVGIAGGAAKCKYLIEELGFDAAVDHYDADMDAKLAAACPSGIDVYFENVGGKVWQAVLPLLNPFSRVPVCGLIAHYNDVEVPPGPDGTPALFRAILTKRLTLRGFIVSDFADQAPAFHRDMSAWIASGQVKYKEDVTIGIENAPEAFIGLLKGKNFGKLVVKVD